MTEGKVRSRERERDTKRVKREVDGQTDRQKQK